MLQLVQLLFLGFNFETYIDVKMVAVYQIISLTVNKVVNFGTKSWPLVKC